MLDFNDFDWGGIPKHMKDMIARETVEGIYERMVPVEEGDVVLDIGAFIGSFTYSILHKNPEHCWVIEPVESFFKTTYKNLKNHQVSFVRGGISDKPQIETIWCGEKSVSPGLNFMNFIKDNCIEKIGFLKTDCEGGEYFIFTDENFNYIKNNIKKIAGEFHLQPGDHIAVDNPTERFIYFRDNFLVKFPKYEVWSVDGVNIKWDLFNAHFLEYYKEVIIHIDNR